MSAEPETQQPILLEAAPEAPNPLRFGLREVFLLTGVAAVIFGLISYLGPLFGVLAATGVVAVLLLGLIFFGIFYHERHGQPWMDKVDRMAIQTTAVLVMLIIGAVATGGGLLAYDVYLARFYQANLERDLGFTSSQGIALRNGFPTTQAIVVDSVKSGGLFEQAGVKKGDVIVTYQNPTKFFATMHDQRGGQMNLELMANGEGKEITDPKLKRSVTVAIPMD